MDSIHGHEVLNMMIESGEQYTHASLEAAIKARFGEQARFHTCSAEGMTAGELVAFLAAKANLLLLKTVFRPIRVRFAVTDETAAVNLPPENISFVCRGWRVLCR